MLNIIKSGTFLNEIKEAAAQGIKQLHALYSCTGVAYRIVVQGSLQCDNLLLCTLIRMGNHCECK